MLEASRNYLDFFCGILLQKEFYEFQLLTNLWVDPIDEIQTTPYEDLVELSLNEPIHVVNVSLNVSLDDDHQMLKY